MVKFSKQFDAQLVPEWRHAYVDYQLLKKNIKKIQLLNTNKNSFDKAKNGSFVSTIFSSMGKVSSCGQKPRDHGPIHVIPLFLPCFPLFCFA